MKPNKEKENHLNLLNKLHDKVCELDHIVKDITYMQIQIRIDGLQQDGWYLGRKSLTDYELDYMQMTDTIRLPEMSMITALLNRLFNYYSIELENAINNFNNLEE